jgi:UDP-N-acetylglucosamine--N-acetylmuramyl-(pentapeptide) pyrophosphoryl-undecaprenol N-acetylglucosamine transferase
MSPRTELIVAGGGTGGHVLAGVAIADAWKQAHQNSDVLFVGAQGGIEERLVPRAGYALKKLRIGSLNRVSLSRRLLTLVQLPGSFLASAWILLKERPRAVIGVGGYASGPLVLLARLLGWMWGAQVAVLEQNAVPGMTNRILARFAHKVLLAFPVGKGLFKEHKTKVTGNPVRAQLQSLPQVKREPFTVFIFGGSQGAMGINTLVLEALPLLQDLRAKIRWIHQTGEKDLERVRKSYEAAGIDGRVEAFIHDMGSCYSQASLVVCRAGSSTLSELAAVKRASVLVPFPFASDNHQEKNARIFSERGAAELFIQGKAKGEDLASLIRDMIQNPNRLAKMEAAVAQLSRPNAAQEIVRELEGSA